MHAVRCSGGAYERLRGSSQTLVVVGAAGMYEARCRACFRPFVDEHASEQLELPVASGVRGVITISTDKYLIKPIIR